MAKLVIEETTLTNIGEAIREKTGTSDLISPSNMPSQIRAIETGGGSTDEWQPQSDWWDIDSILENDTENYPAKIICLLSDSNLTTTINRQNASKIITSDGSSYEGTSSSYSHDWDTSQDKECSFGYKTRYIIYYYSDTNVKFPGLFPHETLYMIVKNFNYTTEYMVSARACFSLVLLQSIKFINSVCFDAGIRYLFFNCSLENVEGLQYNTAVMFDGVNGVFNSGHNDKFTKEFIKNFENQYFSATQIIGLLNGFRGYYLPKILTDNVSNFQNWFANSSIRTIEYLNLNSATNINNMFNNATRLININELYNIKITGLNFSSCNYLNHDTLLRILNALYDYASEGSTNTYTLKLGTTNLAKLTDEEKAIATNKGWTLA